MKTWNVTLRSPSLLGTPIEAKVSAHLSCTNAGVLEFWLINDSALLPSLTLFRAIPAGLWTDSQLDIADNTENAKVLHIMDGGGEERRGASR